jgi:hypothetical protein
MKEAKLIVTHANQRLLLVRTKSSSWIYSVVMEKSVADLLGDRGWHTYLEKQLAIGGDAAAGKTTISLEGEVEGPWAMLVEIYKPEILAAAIEFWNADRRQTPADKSPVAGHPYR